jgi:hypothetical protein
MILRPNDLHGQPLLHVLIGIVVGGLVLTELVIVIFIVEVLRVYVRTLGNGVAELLQHLLEAGFGLAGV